MMWRDRRYDATRLACELGRRVRELRERRGWSQADLARAASMTTSAVDQFEVGAASAVLRDLARLTRALNVDLGAGVRPKAAD
jgi:transcriptional regulator with XRE-family HTH domain